MTIRELTTIEDCRAVAALEREVWGYTDAEDVVPPPVLIVSVKRGGILLGAFDGAGAMKGFVYSIPSVKDGRLGPVVAHARRDEGRARCRTRPAFEAGAAGSRRSRWASISMEWTYDPLQALNAHLNFSKLGVVVEEYEENIYGESSSPLHSGSPTDRFVAEWKLTAPHVERRIAGGGVGIIRDASIASAPLVNPSEPAAHWLAPGPANLALDAPRLLVEIPVGYAEMQLENSSLALEWRMATRAIFQHYFSRGYRAVDFFLARQAGRGHYLLALR